MKNFILAELILQNYYYYSVKKFRVRIFGNARDNNINFS